MRNVYLLTEEQVQELRRLAEEVRSKCGGVRGGPYANFCAAIVAAIERCTKVDLDNPGDGAKGGKAGA
jgi:hypothetical protein